MAVMKILYRFRNTNGDTWTEVYHKTTSDNVDITSDQAIAPSFINKRLAFLSSNCTLRRVTVSVVGGGQPARLRKPDLVGLDNSGTEIKADLAGVAVQYKWFGVDGGTRKSWMRGLRDDRVYINPATGSPSIQPALDTLVQGWVSALNANAYGWLPRKPVNRAIPLQTPRAITNVNGSLMPGLARVTVLGGDVVLDTNKKLSISGVNPKLLPGMNGMWTVEQIAGATFDIRYQTPGSTSVTNPGGTMRPVVYGSVNVMFGAIFYTATTRQPRNTEFPTRPGKSAKALRTLA